MSINGKVKDFTIDDLFVIADRFGIGEAKSVIDDVKSAIKDWERFARTAGVNQKDIFRIGELHLMF